jgi:hypothetical protein
MQATASVDAGVISFSAAATAGAPATVRVVGGNGQSTTRGTILADSLEARVEDAHGNPLAGRWVRWSVAAGGGHVEADSSRTDAQGIARVRWAVGVQPGANRVVASTSALSGDVSFTATGASGPLTLHKVSPLREMRGAGSSNSFRTFADTLVVAVRDANGRAAVGAPIIGDGKPLLTQWNGTARFFYWTTVWIYEPNPPPPWAEVRFEEQRVWFPVPDAAVGEYEGWPDVIDRGPYYTFDELRVTAHVVEGYGRPVPPTDSVRVFDDAGWSTTIIQGDTVMWALGSNAGARTLTACPVGWYEFTKCHEYEIWVESRRRGSVVP